MSDLTATLRRLADACDACDRLAGNFESSVTECFHEQRQVLADALPGIGWDGAVKDLRAMADEADRLRSIADNAPPPADVQMLASANRTLAAEVERLRAEVERLTSTPERTGPDDGDACPSCGYGPVTYHDGATSLSCRDCDWVEGSDV